MNANNRKFALELRVRNTMLFYFLYIVLIYILALCIWPRIQTSQFTIYKYILSENLVKTIVCFFMSTIMWIIVNNRYSENSTFSGRVILLLTMLYFIPGLAICSALNTDWGYILSFLIYYFAIVIADCFIRYPRRPFKTITFKQSNTIFILLIILCLIYPFVLTSVFNSSFSLSKILLTLNDPYGVRADAREKSISWAFLLLEYWGVYFGTVMVTYSFRKKKYWLAIAFVLIELFYFTLQGNRIILFIVGIAIVLGFLKVNNKWLSLIFVGLLVAQFLELILFNGNETIGIVTNVFRRFSVVPNIISPKYYDYFQTATPDYLRGHFPSISALFGAKSEYDFNIGYIIGQQYFGMYLNANTGMVGGAFFEFGNLGVIIDPIMFVISLRIIEKVLFNTDNENIMTVSLIYSSLAINSWAIWSQLCRISYMPLFVLSLYFLFNRMEPTTNIEH